MPLRPIAAAACSPQPGRIIRKLGAKTRSTQVLFLRAEVGSDPPASSPNFFHPRHLPIRSKHSERKPKQSEKPGAWNRNQQPQDGTIHGFKNWPARGNDPITRSSQPQGTQANLPSDYEKKDEPVRQQSLSAEAAEKLEARLLEEEWNKNSRPMGYRSGSFDSSPLIDTQKSHTAEQRRKESISAAERLEAKLLEEEWNERSRGW
ncbi:hypothetical protein BJ875DRAFT_235763 [Amylocarpus encephaloides]|uniref:Uncharacterized protein n=1 Tax=Amylocarpus encephaloides TaxID=45428 RepID=A0A9P8C7E8_9HELO|nr:hypothetical protein BJ875DRAFT_235763 [Amylocarpus encephaloides]